MRVARDLRYPCAIWLPDHAADLHPPGLEVDHEQQEVANESSEREHLEREEVRRGDRTQVRAKERLPRHPLAACRCRLKAVPPKDPLDRVAADLVTEVIRPSSRRGGRR